MIIIIKTYRLELVLTLLCLLLTILETHNIIILENLRFYSWIISILILIIIDITKTNYKIKTLISRFISIPFLILGFNWIVIFCTTDYRKHLRFFGIICGVIFVLIGCYINMKKTTHNNDSN